MVVRRIKRLAMLALSILMGCVLGVSWGGVVKQISWY
jgi:hypothetical protein